VRQEEGGTHADEVETSMMLYIDPASVDMRRAVKEFGPASTPMHLTRRRGAAGTFSDSGVWGDPTLATREKGRVIVEALVTAILADIEAMRHATLPVAGPGLAPAPGVVSPMAPRQMADAPGACTPGDERGIRGMGNAFGAHWSNADATQLAALWAVDGDIVHPDGFTERGRETIRTNRAALFLRREYRGSKHFLTLGNIRCLSPDIAVVDGKWELRGVTDAAGVILPAYEGLLTLVMSRAGLGWLIEAYRYTQKPGAGPAPMLLKRPGFTGAP
jgi:uncharacterized protein (TIGR02246 family)